MRRLIACWRVFLLWERNGATHQLWARNGATHQLWASLT